MTSNSTTPAGALLVGSVPLKNCDEVCALFLFHHESSCCSSKRISTTRTVLEVMTYLHVTG